MYKIYINETPLHLLDLKALKEIPPSDEQNLVAKYHGKPKLLLNYVDMLEKSQRFQTIKLYSEDYNKLITDFEGHFKIIEAAGGVVENQNKEILLIFRRGFWDLPKGKIDEGETPEIAAIREVEEETGVEQLTLGQKLSDTYHTYRDKKGKRILKRTYWYHMSTINQPLIPQEEEDIELAVWIESGRPLTSKTPIYKTIQDVLKEAGAY